MEMEKKNLAIIILAIILAASGVGNVILAIMAGVVEVVPKEKNTLVIGFATNPPALDPIDTWDVPAFQTQGQVIQGLVQYNASNHPYYEIIPVLAASWTWTGADYIEFDLRPGVKFHDGTDWDADVALWNLNRLMWFCNYSGTLPNNATSWLAFPSSLYFAPDGVTPYIADVGKIDDMTIYIQLTFDFAPFLDLLCFAASFMCSPASTPRYTYLNIAQDIIVGTGPYVMDAPAELDVEVRYHKNEDFWGKDVPGWKGPFSRAADILVFDINEDDISRNMDMLALKVDFLQGALPEMVDTFNSSAYHTVTQIGEGLCYFYFTFYCGDHPSPPPGWEQLNVTWRKAIQYTINYTYIADEIYQGLVVRGPTVVPRGMPGHNATADANKIDMDVKKAREIMQSMGFGVGWDTNYPGTNEGDWTSASFRTIQVNELFQNVPNQDMNQLLSQNLELIGVDIAITIRTFGNYLETGENSPWDMEMSFIGWCPDYLDAFNMLEPLFSNTSSANFVRLNDPYIMQLLEQAVITTNAAARQALYMHIQSYLFDATLPDHEWKYPHAPLFAAITTIVHSFDLTYTAYNVLADMWTWEMFLGEWEEE